METFNPLRQPIVGRFSIEASAGTGKTFSITLLWLRLIIEHNLKVDQILVSTFTTAATAELRERLLASLRRAHTCARMLQLGEEPPAGEELEVIRATPASQTGGPAALCLRLANALSAFDLAPIATIHSFCQSLISRHALELGIDASLELAESSQSLLRELCDDFVMRSATDPSLQPGTLQKVALAVSANMSASVLRPKIPSDAEMDDLIRQIIEAAPKAATGLKAGSLKKFQSMVQTLQASRSWEKLTEAQARSVGPEFLELWHRFARLQASSERALQAAIVDTIKTELPRRKSSARVRDFDDVIQTVRQALTSQGPEGPFASAVRSRLHAAIIDECQDSDMAQIEVFSMLFCHRNTLSFIVIGDPKQSIYRFRGADLASYTHLAASVEGAPAMTTNHRSDPGLIGALNTLYGEDYVFPNTVSDTQQHAPTNYIPVTAKAAGARIWDPKISKPVVFQWCGEEDRSSAMSAIASHLAEECARLLADKVEIEDKKTRRRRLLEPGDIAVLANFHKDLHVVRRHLIRKGIPCQSAGSSLGSIFESDEAQDVLAWLDLLAGLENRGDILPKLTTFLGTPLGAFSAEKLRDFKQTPQIQSDQCAEFQKCLPDFGRSGPLPLLLQLLSRRELITANFGFADAERRLANWRQLGSLLQLEHGRGRKSASILRQWLARKIASPQSVGDGSGQEDESSLMKLDSDASSIQLVTVHNSKGLEYPVVFCPFLWNLKSARDRKRSPVALIRREEDWALDIGSPDFDNNISLAVLQEDEEEHRKLYVALTRPRHRLYLGIAPVAGKQAALHLNAARDSVLAKLPGLALSDRPAELWLDRLLELEFSSVLTIEASATRRPHAELADEPTSANSILQKPRTPGAYGFPFFRTASFSSLVKSENEHAGVADRYHEEIEGEKKTETAHDLLQSLGAGGAVLGDQMHQLLEDYLGNHRELSESVADLENGPAWADAINTILDAQITLPEVSSTTLRAIRGACITEMQFHLPAGEVSGEALANALSADPDLLSTDLVSGWIQKISGWPFRAFTGFLQGYIDLIFEHEGRWYVADYKSNQLAGYSRDFLEEAMVKKNYLLQARLYALALHRHLGLHLRNYDFETHFGGVVYLFVRGLPAGGVWFERPSRHALDTLGRVFTPLSR